MQHTSFTYDLVWVVLSISHAKARSAKERQNEDSQKGYVENR